MTRRWRSTALVLAAAVALTGCAASSAASNDDDAENYPTKDIRIVVPWAAGGSGDLTARSLAPLLEAELGASVIVENRPGANGTIGQTHVLDQKADGHTIGIVGPEFPFLPYLGYDLDPTAFTLIGQATAGPAALTVNADSPYETVADLVEAAEANPDSITYSTSAFGSIWHIIGVGFEEEAGIDLVPVPFDGSAPAIAAAAAGDTVLNIDTIGTVMPMVEAGQLRLLGTFTSERDPLTPDVPTMIEQGVDFDAGSWIGLMVSKDVSQDIVEKLSAALEVAATDPSFVKVIENAKLVAQHRDAAEMVDFFDLQVTKFSPWAELTKENR